MASKRKLEVQIIGDEKSLNRAFKSGIKGADRFGSRLNVLGRVSSKTGAALGLFATGAAGVGVALTGGLVVGLKKSVEAFGESEAIAKQTTTALKSTGGAANVTAKEIGKLATAISRKSGIDDEAIQQGQNLLLTFTQIRNEAGRGNRIFDKTTRAAADLSAAMKAAGKEMSISDAALQLGKALNDPAAGMSRLQRIGVTFTQKQKDQAKALQESGDMLSAQKIILRELNKEFGGSAKAAGETTVGAFNKLKVAVGNLQEKVGAALAPALKDAAEWMTALVEQTIAGEGPIAAAFDTVKGAVKRAKDAITGLKESFEGLVAGGKSPLAAIGTMIADGLSSGVKSVDWRGIGATIAAGLSTAFAATGDLPAVISSGIGLAIANVDTGALAGKMATVAIKMLATLADPSFWAAHWKEILSIVTLVIPVGKLLKIPGAEPLFKYISGPVLRAIGKVGTAALKLFGKAGALAIKGLLAGITKEFPKAAAFVGRIAGRIVDEVKLLPTRLRLIGLGAGEGISKGLSKAIGKVGEIAGRIVGRIIKIIGTIVGRLLGLGGRAIGALIKGIDNKTGGLLGKIADVIKRVVGKFIALPGRLIEAGRNLIGGLITGIKEKAGELISTIKEFVTDRLPGFVKKALGIESPSKVFKGIGHSVIDGLIAGILTKRDAVKAGLQKGLLFPFDAAIAALERKKETLQAVWDKIDARAERSSIVSGDSTSSSGSPRRRQRGGSIVTAGKLLQRRGLQVGENPAFGGVTPGVHNPRGFHPTGQAIDVNFAGGGAPELAKLKKALAFIRKRFRGQILEAMIEDAGKANQHLHVAIKATKLRTTGGPKATPGLSRHQRSNASTILSVGQRMGATGKQMLAAIEAALVESNLKNLKGGDRDSVGVFQQRASQGWTGLRNVPKAAREFFRAAMKVGGKNMSAGQLAQAVQRSAFPERYDQRKGDASGIVAALRGGPDSGGNLKETRKQLREFNREAKRARLLAKIDIRIGKLTQIKAFKDAIKGVREQVKGLAAEAAAVWREGREKTLDAARTMALGAVANSAQAQELAGLQAAEVADQNATELAGLNSAIEDARYLVDHSGGKTKQDAIKALAEAEDALADYKRGKRIEELGEWIENENAKVDSSYDQQVAGLDAEEAAYAASLKTRLGALTTNLAKQKTTYAQWAKEVNKILATYGLAVETSPEEEATINAGKPSVGGGKDKDKPKTRKRGGKTEYQWPNGSWHSRPHQGRAMGGPVFGGVPYTVGERGREVFVPETNGRIIPNHRLRAGGGSSVGIVNHGTINIGSRKAAEVMANRTAYKVAFG